MTLIPSKEEAIKAMEDITVNEPEEEARVERIVMAKQKDGNWRGIYNKGTKYMEARQSDPNTVLTLLVTHE